MGGEHVITMKIVEKCIRDSIKVKELILQDKVLISNIQAAGELVKDAIENDGKVLLCGKSI